MGDLVRALPAIIVIFLGLASLAFSIASLMMGLPPIGPFGPLAGILAFILAALIAIKAFTY
ncbi:MAG: hypothetical protein ACT4N2_09955 [Hyphomicrobium sp.]